MNGLHPELLSLILGKNKLTHASNQASAALVSPSFRKALSDPRNKISQNELLLLRRKVRKQIERIARRLYYDPQRYPSSNNNSSSSNNNANGNWSNANGNNGYNSNLSILSNSRESFRNANEDREFSNYAERLKNIYLRKQGYKTTNINKIRNITVLQGLSNYLKGFNESTVYGLTPLPNLGNRNPTKKKLVNQRNRRAAAM
jgi:hypothetical protein